jgi:hypothetical protein
MSMRFQAHLSGLTTYIELCDESCRNSPFSLIRKQRLIYTFFFERKPWGNAPPSRQQEIYIKKEEAKLQRGGTYVRPNQWLGNERGQAKKKQQTRLQGLGREGRGQQSNRAALHGKLQSTKPKFDRRMTSDMHLASC